MLSYRIPQVCALINRTLLASSEASVITYICYLFITSLRVHSSFLLFVTTGIQNNLWARFVTLPNQERIWTLTVTDKSVNKPTEQGISLALFCKMALVL